MIKSVMRGIFGTQNDRFVKLYATRALQINKLEPKYEKMSDDELRGVFNEFKAKVQAEEISIDEILYDVFAIA